MGRGGGEELCTGADIAEVSGLQRGEARCLLARNEVFSSLLSEWRVKRIGDQANA